MVLSCYIGLLIALWVGAVLGLVLFSMLAISKENDQDEIRTCRCR